MDSRQKAEFFAALKRAGQLEAFHARMDELRIKFMMTGPQAWEKALEEYRDTAANAPPRPVAKAAPPRVALPPPEEKPEPEEANLSRDIDWVYRHSGLEGEALEEAKKTAPGPGAVGLLNWVKANGENQRSFF